MLNKGMLGMDHLREIFRHYHSDLCDGRCPAMVVMLNAVRNRYAANLVREVLNSSNVFEPTLREPSPFCISV
jgi:hypothetical protein